MHYILTIKNINEVRKKSLFRDIFGKAGIRAKFSENDVLYFETDSHLSIYWGIGKRRC